MDEQPEEKPKPRDGAPDSNEFFYVDKDGRKTDAKLHGPILRAVDWPVDEKIAGPIRERHRKAYLESKRKSK